MVFNTDETPTSSISSKISSVALDANACKFSPCANTVPWKSPSPTHVARYQKTICKPSALRKASQNVFMQKYGIHSRAPCKESSARPSHHHSTSPALQITCSPSAITFATRAPVNSALASLIFDRSIFSPARASVLSTILRTASRFVCHPGFKYVRYYVWTRIGLRNPPTD